MAVRTDTGKPSDNIGVLVATAGLSDPKACQASFAQASRHLGAGPSPESRNVHLVNRSP